LDLYFPRNSKKLGLQPKRLVLRRCGIGDKKVEMEMAQESPIRLSAEGRSEGMFGKILGCEDMKERGEAKLKTAQSKIQ
jgi:hypothetical protein